MRPIEIDDIARIPRPGTSIPEQPAFSPDGSMLTYLAPPDEQPSLSRALWRYDVATGEAKVIFRPDGEGVTDQSVSADEALRRERQRQLIGGVTSYAWAKHASMILVPLLGDLYVIEGDAFRKVGSDALDPHFSSDGRTIAFVRAGDLHVVDVASGEEHRLTTDAQPGLTNGLAEFVAQEEMGRARGFWWSPDGSMIAFEQADERHIPIFVIPHWGEDQLSIEEHRYPFAGAENARIRLGVIPATGGEVRWMDLGDFEYLARVAWHPDGRLFVQTLTRDQRRLELRAYDVDSGSYKVLLVDESPHWINLHDDLRFFDSTGEFTWTSEATGMRRLELRAPDGALVRTLTDGAWPIDGVVELDDEGRRVAFTGSPDPTEGHVYITGVDGGDTVQLSARGGFTTAPAFSPGFEHWVEVRQSRSTPPTSVLQPGEHALHAQEEIELDLITPELFSFENRDGVTLFGAFYRPPRLPAPLIVAVYGGPHAQLVQDSWALTIDLQTQYLAARGFAVIKVDNRGSDRRGMEFEAAIDRRMGTVEIADQIDGVRFAQSQGWIDGDRVGMTGWSYGGYMTLMCILKAPEVFKVGVAGAPCTAMDGYDTCYTERYMGTPQEEPEAYRVASALTYAGNLRGKLLIVHGMIDENVHFRHTARFLEALAKTEASCDLLLYPRSRHFPRNEQDRKNMHRRLTSYFEQHL